MVSDRHLLVFLSFCMAVPGPILAQSPTMAQEVAAAVLPLPGPLRETATVVLLDRKQHAQTLRRGSNGMVCLADEPGDSIFDVRCYHESFIPLIYRIRELAELDDSTLDSRIDGEIHSGRLRLPPGPTAGYRMYGPLSGYNPAINSVSDTIDTWQSVHFPYQTAQAAGLDTLEDGARPYMMSSGTFWAHVMIMQRPLRY